MHISGVFTGPAPNLPLPESGRMFPIVGLHVIAFFARGFVTAAGLLLVHPNEGRSVVRLVDRDGHDWTFVNRFIPYRTVSLAMRLKQFPNPCTGICTH